MITFKSSFYKNKAMKTVHNDLEDKYDFKVSIIHWLSAFFILSLIPTGKILRETEGGFLKLALYQYHVAIGVAVSLLTLYRVFLFFTRYRPKSVQTGWVWHDKLIYWSHRAFYWLLIILGISGLATILTTPQLKDALYNVDFKSLPKRVDSGIFDIHEIAANVMITLLIFHVGGVILHYIRFKENLLERIFF
jgi:cytochrome b561